MTWIPFAIGLLIGLMWGISIGRQHHRQVDVAELKRWMNQTVHELGDGENFCISMMVEKGHFEEDDEGGDGDEVVPTIPEGTEYQFN